MLNGSAWSTEEKYLRRCKRKVRYFLDRAQNEEGRNGGAAHEKRRRDKEMSGMKLLKKWWRA